MSQLCVKWRFRAHPRKRKGARGTARNPAWKPLLERNLCAAAPHRLTIRVAPQSERFSARSEARKMLEAPQAPRQQGAAPRVSPCGQRACRQTGLGRRNADLSECASEGHPVLSDGAELRRAGPLRCVGRTARAARCRAPYGACRPMACDAVGCLPWELSPMSRAGPRDPIHRHRRRRRDRRQPFRPDRMRPSSREGLQDRWN